MPPPNEQLYSSLYGREMEMMRKMFKNSDDRLENTMMLGAANATNLPKSFHPNYPNIFPPNNPKYFEPAMMRFEPSPAEKMRKHDPKQALYPIGHPLFPSNRQAINPINTNNSQLYDDVVVNKHQQGLLKPLFDDKQQHPHFNVNFNNKTETSLITKSYSGFENSLSNNDTTNHNNLLLSESQFVSHNFNVNNYTNRSDKNQSTFLNNRGNHSPSDYVNATNNNSSEFDLNKSGDNNVGGGLLATAQLKVTSNIKCTDAPKEFGNGIVTGMNFDDEKSRNSSNDNDDDEFTNL